MIVEYHFLLDLNKVFKNKKYIIHVFKDKQEEISQHLSVLSSIETFKKDLFIKTDVHTQRILNRVMKVEKQQRIM